MHHIKALIDFVQTERMRNQIVDIYFPFHIPINNLRHVAAPLSIAERSTAPDSTGYQLKRPGGYFLTRCRNTNDDALSPTFVAAFQSVAHYIGITNAFKGIIDAAVGHINDRLNQIVNVVRVYKVCHAELLG